MTQAKAQAVASAIINAGYHAVAFVREKDNEWVVRARSTDFNVNASAIAALANNQAVSGKVAEAEFV